MPNNQFDATVKLINDKVMFSGTTRSNPTIIMDYFPPIGDGQGYTGLEMLLQSFSGCSGTAVAFLLRKMNKTISELTITAKGIRTENPPYAFRSITLHFNIKSPDISSGDMEKVIHLAEESVCPVWAMIRGNVEIIPGFTLNGKPGFSSSNNN